MSHMFVLFVVIPYIGFLLFCIVKLQIFLKNRKTKIASLSIQNSTERNSTERNLTERNLAEQNSTEQKVVKQVDISVVIPIKGPVPQLDQIIQSYYDQNYTAKIELILAFGDATDPSLHFAKRLATRAPAHFSVVIVEGCPNTGLNPKNNNLYYGYQKTSHDWIYFADVDSRLETNHFQMLLLESQGDEKIFVSSMTVHYGAKTFGAFLETIGTNLELIIYFVLMGQKKGGGLVNGAANFFHRNLLKKVGGAEIALNSLTEDLLLEKKFISEGNATGRLASTVIWVQQEKEGFEEYLNRQTRWIKIVKCFKPALFWVAPLNWVAQWSFLFGVLFLNKFLLLCALTVFVARVFTVWAFQRLLGLGVREQVASVFIVIYDFLSPVAWFRALIMTHVVWGGRRLRVLSDGQLLSSEIK